MHEPEPTIFTIGHGAESFSHLAERLDRHRVRTLVDVRSVPYSQNVPEFSSTEIERVATAAGFGYRWLGDRLGGKPTNPELLTPSGQADYQAIGDSPEFLEGLDEIAGLATSGTVALLCAEVDPGRCHRSLLIAPRLTEKGYRIEHILGDGEITPYQPDLGI